MRGKGLDDRSLPVVFKFQQVWRSEADLLCRAAWSRRVAAEVMYVSDDGLSVKGEAFAQDCTRFAHGRLFP